MEDPNKVEANPDPTLRIPLSNPVTPKRIPFKCVVCNGWGTLSYGKKKCHACKGLGYIVINNDEGIDSDLIEK